MKTGRWPVSTKTGEVEGSVEGNRKWGPSEGSSGGPQDYWLEGAREREKPLLLPFLIKARVLLESRALFPKIRSGTTLSMHPQQRLQAPNHVSSCPLPYQPILPPAQASNRLLLLSR